MVELAIGVAAFLFLCWVAINGIIMVCTIFAAITESKEGRWLLGLGIPLILLWIALEIWA